MCFLNDFTGKLQRSTLKNLNQMKFFSRGNIRQYKGVFLMAAEKTGEKL
jgi:hypothetical protein